MASQLVARVSTTAAPTLAAAAAAAVATAAVSSDIPGDRRAAASPAVLVHSAMAASPATTSSHHRFTHAIADPAASRFKTAGGAVASSVILRSATAAAITPRCPESSLAAASPIPYHPASPASYYLPPVSYRGLSSTFTGSPIPYTLKLNRLFSPSRQQLSRLIAPSTLFPITRLSQRSVTASYGNPGGNTFGFPLGHIFSIPPSSSLVSGPFNGDVSSFKPFHQWHRPAVGSNGDEVAGDSDGSGTGKSEVAKPVVVLLGWLGAQQRHLRRYAEWYTSRGFDVITFVIPFKDVLSIRPGEKAEIHVDSLVDELHRWLSGTGPEVALSATSSAPVNHVEPPKEPRTLIFHTFSNTGWLAYGAVLNRLHEKFGKAAVDVAIKGCVVDSAPILEQDPQVWARGFAAAILQKRSSATRAGRKAVPAAAEPPASSAADSEVSAGEGKEGTGKMWGVTDGGEWEAQPRDEAQAAGPDAQKHRRSSLGFASINADIDVVEEGEGEGRRGKVVKAEEDAVEKTLLSVLRRFFTWLLQVPVVKTKLDTVTSTLASEQPQCPQLYLYSTADTVIPAQAVESFITRQRARGCTVLAKRFDWSPHVDHYRTFPEVYSAVLETFLKKCLPQPKQAAAAAAGAAEQ
ncbi:hypothetical protein CLOP_g18397 [Closterium sp. NIES-67]|nr:hypothetical protein CLOP_g18397 [Closterium sp. NIES-67]